MAAQELIDIENIDQCLNQVKYDPSKYVNPGYEKPEGNIPGTQSIYVKTFGCSHNISDSEVMTGILAKYGYNIVDAPEQADLWLVNSCTVKNPSQDAMTTIVRRAKEQSKKIVVAGCVPQADRKIRELEDISIVGVTQIDRILEVVEQTLNGNVVKLLAKKELPSLDLPKIRRNKLVEIIPISTGCLGACTYCKTKHARGHLGSYEPQVIVGRVVQALGEGVKDIWLTSEDSGAYGRDIGSSLPDLLWQIIKVLKDDVMLRVGMTNPPFILEHLQEMSRIFKHPRIYGFLHIPVQAGDNTVLERMYREYTVEDFCQVVDTLRKNVPKMYIATDIICGFPGETDEQFQSTLDLVDKYRFPSVYISQFYPRPDTPAAKMQRVPTQIVKQRSTALTRLLESYRCFDSYLNTTQQVFLRDFKEGQENNTMIGHTKFWVKVILPRQEELIGGNVWTKIIKVDKWHVEGIIVPPPKSYSWVWILATFIIVLAYLLV